MSAARLTAYRRYVAANVRGLRLEAKLTQEAFVSRVSGLAVRTLQTIEAGHANISLELLVGMAEALHVEPARLLRPATFKRTKPGRPSKKR